MPWNGQRWKQGREEGIVVDSQERFCQTTSTWKKMSLKWICMCIFNLEHELLLSDDFICFHVQ